MIASVCRRSPRWRSAWWVLLFCVAGATGLAQQAFDTDAVGPERFVAVHGRRAVVMGYATGGLEAWAYPLQLVSHYTVGFRSSDDTSEIAGNLLLRRVTYEPQAVTRTYIGPDFIVRERLFVPLEQSAVLIRYTVASSHPVSVVINFTPVLNLMWPSSLGGQSVQWRAGASAYVLTDGTQQHAAMVGSPDVESHDEIRNSIEPGALGDRLAFSMRAGGGGRKIATVVIAQVSPGETHLSDQVAALIRQQPMFEQEAQHHYADVAAHSFRVITPDASVNKQLSWAQIALDQASVCNPVLGCGLVAGYGPSRGGRRPQYDWFFAGDGLIAIQALVNTGAYDRARDALTFIAKYQNADTGMIWHELSQSADPADWATKYPYMFVHVDITFQYLIAVEQYVRASGDVNFLREHWAGIAAAYRYCQALLNPSDGLPRIPADKEGGDEQDKITEDLGLSVSWVSAAAAYSHLARWMGHAQQAGEAQQASERGRRSAASHYWDDSHHRWIDGYNAAGGPILRRGDDGMQLVSGRILDQVRTDSLLDQLASSDFQTDWGTRGVARNSSQFDPSSYSKGSVSAMASAGVAAAFWSEHRPVTALAIWQSLLPWGTLDSMGHMHELLAGDYYHQQAESVPEQTWSSAAFLSSVSTGLLGFARDAIANQLTFAPHVPAAWHEMSVENIPVSGGTVALTLSQAGDGLELLSDNSGAPVTLRFSPEIPLGAQLLGADWDGKPVPAQREDHAQDTHASLTITLPHGKGHGRVRFAGGAALQVKGPLPQLGEPSRSIKIISVGLRAKQLILNADVPEDTPLDSSLVLWTQRPPTAVHGATSQTISPGVYQLVPVLPAGEAVAGAFQRREIVVDLGEAAGK